MRPTSRNTKTAAQKPEPQINTDENYDIAIAMSSPLADPVLGHCTGWVYLNQCHCTSFVGVFKYLYQCSVTALAGGI